MLNCVFLPYKTEVDVNSTLRVVSLFGGRSLDKTATSLPSFSSTTAIVGKGLWTKW